MTKPSAERAARILVATLLSSTTTVAQQPYLDSLLRVWNDPSQPDSSRVGAYQKFVWEGYMNSRPDTVEVLAEDLLVFARQHNYPKAAGLAYYELGAASGVLGNFLRAIEHYHRCLAIYEEIGNKKGIADSFNGMGLMYWNLDNYPMALEYHQRSLMIAEEIGDKERISNSLNNIGILHFHQSNYPSALEYYNRSLAMDEERKDSSGIAGTLNNIGMIYSEQGNYPRALECYQKAMALNDELGNHQWLAYNLGNIGHMYDSEDNYPRALEYYQKSLTVSEETGDMSGIGSSLSSIGRLHGKHGKSALALDPCARSLAMAKEIEDLSGQRDACDCLYAAYKDLGKDHDALNYHERMIVLADSIFNEEKTKKITQLEMQYEFDKKDAATRAAQEKKDAVAAQELKRQKLVRNGIGGGLTFALLFLGVVWRQRNRINKEKKRSEELLLNILPGEVAEELKAKGSAEAVQIDQVTVLFTDFKGFTAMSERLSPQELVRDLNDCFSAFDHITGKYGIEKIKTIGDAYMAAGGLPTPNTTHATDVIKAAMEMRDFIAEGKAQKIAAGLPYFEIRIGIHTGPVVAGIVGVKKFQYDIWGDTVNTASRMESSGEVGQVNISEATYDLVKDEPGLTFTPRGKVQAKGKGEMEMYFVTST